MGTLWRDLRYAARLLTSSPAFTQRTSGGEGQSLPVSHPVYKFYSDQNEVFSGLLCRGGATLALSAESYPWSMVSRQLFVSGDSPLAWKGRKTDDDND